MDLKDFKATDRTETGATLTLLHPVSGKPITNEDETPWTITLRGPDSKPYQRKQHELQDKRLNSGFSQKSQRVKLSASDLEGDALELTIAATVGWDGIIDQGEPLAFSADAARKLYREFPWIREQVDAFIADRANFLGKLLVELLAYARQQFEDRQRVSTDGVTDSAAMEQAAKTLRKLGIVATADDLDAQLEEITTPPPAELAHLWTVFLKLSVARGSNGFGPLAITFESIVAWSQLSGIELDPFAVDVIGALDRVFLEVFTADKASKSKSGSKDR